MKLWKTIRRILESQWFFHFALAQVFLKVLRLPHGLLHQKNALFEHKIEWLKSFFVSFYLDLPVVAYYFLPLWVLHLFGSKRFALNHAVFSITCLVLMVITGIDVSYYPFTGTHINSGIIELIRDPGNKILPYILSYWYLVILILILTYLIYTLKNKSNYTLYNKDIKWPGKIALGFLFVSGLIIAARGGFYLKPLRSINIGKFVHPKLISYTNNGPFEIYSSLDATAEEEPSFGNPNAFNWQREYKGNAGSLKNVCIIVVESLSKEYLDIDSGGLTPFINSLRKKSMDFSHCFASGRRSKEMPPGIFLGMSKILKDDYISSRYSRNKVRNAFSLYTENGYSSSFYHGGANGTLEFESFLKYTGLTNYYGMNQYPNKEDYDGAWGISDRKYLNYYANELNQCKKPFFSSIFTLSSHHPYKTEPAYKSTLKKGPYENSQSIRYIDTSLSLFFKKIEKEPWFKNTLFVITADHTSISNRAFYKYNIGRYWVPFFIYDPQKQKGTTITHACGQTDIVPTLNSMTGISGKWFNPGKNAMDSIQSFVVMRSDNEFTCIQYPYVLYTSYEGKPVEFFKINEKLQQEDLALKGTKFKQMHTYTLNYVRQFYHHILNNSWNCSGSLLKEP